MPKFLKPKKKLNNKNAKLILLFSITFVATLFLVSAMFKNFSPPVDVNIGGQDFVAENDTDDFPQKDIDDRLKWIQFEDNMSESPVVNEVQQNDSTEKTIKKTFNNVNIKNDTDKEINNDKNLKTQYIRLETSEPPIPVKYTPPTPSVSEIKNSAQKPALANKMTKVYVGYYSSIEQANKVKNDITNSISGYQPYVKQINNNYIVQIASFSDREKAVYLKLELSDKGYPARLLTE
ncbi:SPOR domain-containing protein [bacterium]|nr:SPOR domain-containing protein [bacterium]